MLDLKKDKGTDYVLSWKSKGYILLNLDQYILLFLHSIKLSGFKVGIKFDKDPLPVEQTNGTTKIITVYIIYDLDNCSSNNLRNFTLKNCFFGGITIVTNSDRGKWMYSGYGIPFNGKGMYSSVNDYARNVVIFGFDNSLSSHADNSEGNGEVKEILLVLMETLFYQRKSVVLILVKQRKKIYLSLQCNSDNTYLFVNGKEVFMFKANNAIVNF